MLRAAAQVRLFSREEFEAEKKQLALEYSMG